MRIVAALLPLLAASLRESNSVDNDRLTITNGCASYPIWIDNYAINYKHIEGIDRNVKINSGESKKFPMQAKGAAYYPKFGCSDDGNDCTSGDKGAKPHTLFEFTSPAYGNGDAYDISFVDGFNLPFKLEMEGCKTGRPLDLPQSSVIDCSELSIKDCPTDENLGGTSYDLSKPAGGQKGCMAPCFQLQYSHIAATSQQAEQYCCQNEYHGTACRQGDILQTKWIKNVRAKCRRTYLYPLDDSEGNQACTASPRSYHLTFYCLETGASGKEAKDGSADSDASSGDEEGGDEEASSDDDDEASGDGEKKGCKKDEDSGTETTE